MLAAFDLAPPVTQAKLYACYRVHFETLQQVQLPPVIRGAMLHALSELYDGALTQTVDAKEAAKSPRSPRRSRQ